MNEFHPYQAVAIDLDGTLLSHDLSISAANHQAIERLHQAGLRVILASGRHHSSMAPFARNLPQVEWMVSAQGSFAADTDLQTVLYDSHLDPSKAALVIDVGVRHRYSIIVYARSGIYALGQGEWVDYYTRLAGITPTQTSKEQILRQAIFKVVLIGSEQRVTDSLDLPEVRAWDLYMVRSLANIVEFAGLGTSKAHGLRPLLAHLGLTPEQLVAFGDAPNDIPMFAFAGFSYAMDHGWPDAKAAAHAIAPPGPPESAFARAVEDLARRCAAAR